MEDEKINFRDIDETEIDSEDLIQYILKKQSDSFILNICKETSATTGKSVFYNPTILLCTFRKYLFLKDL